MGDATEEQRRLYLATGSIEPRFEYGSPTVAVPSDRVVELEDANVGQSEVAT
jgi:hypothetical protein